MSSSSKNKLAEGVDTLLIQTDRILNRYGEEGLLDAIEFSNCVLRSGLDDKNLSKYILGRVDSRRSSLLKKLRGEEDKDRIRKLRTDQKK